MRTMKHTKLLMLLLAIAAAVIVLLTMGTAHAEAPEPTGEQVYDMRMEDWLDRLQDWESGKRPLSVELDVNGKYSYGCLRYQMGTWSSDSRKYGVDGEIMDCGLQRRLARITVEREPRNGWRRWYNTVKRIGMPPEKTAS